MTLTGDATSLSYILTKSKALLKIPSHGLQEQTNYTFFSQASPCWGDATEKLNLSRSVFKLLLHSETEGHMPAGSASALQ